MQLKITNMEIKYLYKYENIHIYYVDEIESTNTYLKENYNSFLKPMCLIAKKQTNGRGRYDRVWQSDNDLIFSFLFDKLYPNEIIAPLSIVLALKDNNINSGIKWPNDIYIEDKKLSGILIENSYEGNKLLSSVVGIGINREKKDNVISTYLLKYIESFDNIELIKEIIKKYVSLINTDINTLISLYKNNSIVIGKYIYYHDKTYQVISIDEKGHLVIKDIYDNIITISSDEISIKEALKRDED